MRKYKQKKYDFLSRKHHHGTRVRKKKKMKKKPLPGRNFKILYENIYFFLTFQFCIITFSSLVCVLCVCLHAQHAFFLLIAQTWTLFVLFLYMYKSVQVLHKLHDHFCLFCPSYSSSTSFFHMSNEIMVGFVRTECITF